MDIGNCVNEIESLYLQYRTLPDKYFCDMFKILINLEIIDIINLNIINLKKNLTNINKIELNMLLLTEKHYNDMNSKYNNILFIALKIKKEQNNVKAAKYAKFCNTITANPNSFLLADYKQMIDTQCPKPPTNNPQSGGDNKNKSNKKPTKKHITHKGEP